MSEGTAMGGITAARIKELRDRTGVGMAKCKAALTEANGDMELAIVNLRKAGIASAVKKEGRETKEGAIAAWEANGTLALIEINAETDFVVNNDLFQDFLKQMAEEAAKTKPADVDAFLAQKFSGDEGLTIDEYRATIIQKIGENIQIRRVQIFEKGADQSFGVYSHMGGKIVCVTTVDGSADESELAKEVAMHAAATRPSFLSPEDVPTDVIEQEKDIAREQLKGKPENIMDKILTGKVNAYYDQNCLTRQAFVRDDKVTINQLVENRAKEAGKTLKLSNFLCWAVGE